MSNSIIADCLVHLTKPEDNANLLRLRSLNYFMQGSIDLALQDTLTALKLLGVDVDPSPTRFAAEMMFTDVTNAILAVGHDGIYSLSRTTDPKHILAIQLLNDAGTNAYWSPSSDFAEVIGLTVCHGSDISSLRDVNNDIDSTRGSPVCSTNQPFCIIRLRLSGMVLPLAQA